MGLAVSVNIGFQDGLTLGWGTELRGSWALNNVYCSDEGTRYGVGPSLQYARGNGQKGRLTLAAQAGVEIDRYLLTTLSEVGATLPLDGTDPRLHLGVKAFSLVGQLALRGNPEMWTLGLGPELGGSFGYYGDFFCDSV